MKTGLTKKQKTTDVYYNAKDPLAEVYTHDTNLKKRLRKYAAKYPEAAAGSHYKNAHQTRNRAMVDRSDLVVFCTQRDSGGAWQTMKYAKKQGKPCINLNEWMEESE